MLGIQPPPSPHDDAKAVSTPRSGDDIVDDAIELVARWLGRAEALESAADRDTMSTLRDLVLDDAGVEFVMAFVDRVLRPDDDRVAADQMRALVETGSTPAFLSRLDSILLAVGARLAPSIPRIVMPLARRRMRAIVGHLVAPAEPAALARHLDQQRRGGWSVNVNLLGEAVLGEREAESRLDRLIELLHQPDVDYVSVKISAVASQLNHWDHAGSLRRVTERAATLLDAAASVDPPTFVNFDMEEHHDLRLTVDAFMAVLDDPTRRHLDAGIVLQAYLPDAFDTLRAIVEWANARHRDGGGQIKIRLVKGANLAMERVDAEIHGWEQAPYGSKLEADASFRRCLDWAFDTERLAGVRIGVASHNLFDVAWTSLLAAERGVTDRVQFEMLQGMAPGAAKAVNETVRTSPDANDMLLYTPAVSADDFDVAIGYLFRRLEENASTDNFMRALLDLSPEGPEFAAQAAFFREGVARRVDVDGSPRRTQDRSAPVVPRPLDEPFRNEPDTDPVLPANQRWVDDVMSRPVEPCSVPVMTDIVAVEAIVAAAVRGAAAWGAVAPSERRRVLSSVGDELAARRGDLIATMMTEANKTIAEADVEVSEAIDFARWYADRSVELDSIPGVRFTPFGVVAVVPPWNFPTAIPAGGVLASLAAGNGVVFKPAPQTPRCAELVAEACWAAGVPADALHFVRTPDDHVGRAIVDAADAVILTGSSETADLFRSWKPDMNLFAETSGKNVLIVTPNADLDLAAADLARSAFGHAGQKCSAASLAILVGDVATSERFRRQLVDAAESLTVGDPRDLASDIAPLVGGGNDRLTRAATQLDPGERFLLRPTIVGNAMSPGIRDGVRPGSWFHRTECFGPVLGLMAADTLDDAIAIANSSDFGLTGGIHSLDPAEIEHWCDRIEVGNGYVNRPITGAIVQRQPFGGWKRSSVGPGAKAGGINYVMQLGTWTADPSQADQVSTEASSIGLATEDYATAWAEHFTRSFDETGLEAEANVFRYRPLDAIGVAFGPAATADERSLIRRAAAITGTRLVEPAEDEPIERFFDRLVAQGVDRVRAVGLTGSKQDDIERHQAANRAGIHLAAGPVTSVGRIELQHYVREQAVSVTLHRFGNLVGSVSPFQTSR